MVNGAVIFGLRVWALATGVGMIAAIMLNSVAIVINI